MLKQIKNRLSKWKWEERKVVWGMENKDKTFYVIRRNSKSVGLFSYVLTALGHMKTAEERGYIPVVDMKNYVTPYLNKEHPMNVWEYYFEQPAGYGLDSISRSRNVVFSSGEVPESFPDYPMLESREEVLMWRSLFHKYIRLNKETEEYIDSVQEKLFKEERILGVLCRGTDYQATKPKGHPIQPEVEQVIIKVATMMEERNCTKVYLATEVRKILQRFRDTFGDKLIFPDVELRPYNDGELITEIELKRKDDKRLKGLEYLTQIALLSRCCCLISGKCGGCYGALLMSEGYEEEFIWNLGLYG